MRIHNRFTAYLVDIPGVAWLCHPLCSKLLQRALFEETGDCLMALEITHQYFSKAYLHCLERRKYQSQLYTCQYMQIRCDLTNVTVIVLHSRRGAKVGQLLFKAHKALLQRVGEGGPQAAPCQQHIPGDSSQRLWPSSRLLLGEGSKDQRFSSCIGLQGAVLRGSWGGQRGKTCPQRGAL